MNAAQPMPAPSDEPVAVAPSDQPAIVASPDEPRYVPETGDAQYGSKLTPYDRTLQGSPPTRFNDATGQ